jgi:hypothetical protein
MERHSWFTNAVANALIGLQLSLLGADLPVDRLRLCLSPGV